MKVVPHRSFNGLRYLSDSQIIPLQIPIASLTPNKEEWSYRRTISNKQSRKALHHSSTSTEKLERYTIMQYLLYSFLPKQHLMVVWVMEEKPKVLKKYDERTLSGFHVNSVFWAVATPLAKPTILRPFLKFWNFYSFKSYSKVQPWGYWKGQ